MCVCPFGCHLRVSLPSSIYLETAKPIVTKFGVNVRFVAQQDFESSLRGRFQHKLNRGMHFFLQNIAIYFFSLYPFRLSITGLARLDLMPHFSRYMI